MFFSRCCLRDHADSWLFLLFLNKGPTETFPSPDKAYLAWQFMYRDASVDFPRLTSGGRGSPKAAAEPLRSGSNNASANFPQPPSSTCACRIEETSCPSTFCMLLQPLLYHNFTFDAKSFPCTFRLGDIVHQLAYAWRLASKLGNIAQHWPHHLRRPSGFPVFCCLSHPIVGLHTILFGL